MRSLVPSLLFAALFVATVACKTPGVAPPPELSVAAATSLREVMPELVRAYVKAHPDRRVAVTYGASGDLKKQVEAGAPIDAVLFAGAKPVDDLISEGRVDSASRHVIASNELVLVGQPRDGGASPLTFASLTSIPAAEKLAIGDPRTVPAGEYARDYLTSLGEWTALQPRLVFGGNVAAVLVYARRDEAVAAVVYRTELRGVTDLVELDVARGANAPHPKVVAGSVHGASEQSTAFLQFVTSAEGEKVLASFGFGPP